MIEDLVQEVDIEKLYEHVKELEGIKHHKINPEKLADAADYIRDEMKSYGLRTNEHTFSFPGIDQTFRNIEGVIGTGSKAEILVTSHYDTVDNSPGANDNASAVAAMLETARILAKKKFKEFNIRFISFTLEELHPVRYNVFKEKALELELLDDTNRYTSQHVQQMIRKFNRSFFNLNRTGKSYEDAAKEVYHQLKDNLNEKETKYLEFLIDNFKDIRTTDDWIGKTGLVGSSKWMEQAIKDKKQIIGVLNLETIGYTSKQKQSQKYPSKLFKLFPKYKVNNRKEIGNFIAVIGDKNSKKLAKLFCKQCKREEIELPNVNLGLPFDFKTIATKVRDLLRSDHAPFWREGIPALMITDTANFRYPFYHTEADTIDKLDFEFIKKVCQATIACVSKLNIV